MRKTRHLSSNRDNSVDQEQPYKRDDFLRDLGKASKKLASGDDASRERDAPQKPEKSDRTESET